MGAQVIVIVIVIDSDSDSDSDSFESNSQSSCLFLHATWWEHAWTGMLEDGKHVEKG